MRALLLTAIAMLAFAANSLLCRLALGASLIDAASFTTVRIAAGAATLGLLIAPRLRIAGKPAADWRSIAALFGYMICFSFAYISLGAGTGALILFAAVQLTMISVALRSGELFTAASWAGLIVAIAGLVYLVSPGITAPEPVAAALMAAAGVAWGAYSLLGRRASDPLQATAFNFMYALPLALAASFVFRGEWMMTSRGAALAALSGSVASGMGYYLWYSALRELTAIRAATVQLSVPVIAAIGGVLMLGEALTVRLVLASIATLGGVAVILRQKAATGSGSRGQ